MIVNEEYMLKIVAQCTDNEGYPIEGGFSQCRFDDVRMCVKLFDENAKYINAARMVIATLNGKRMFLYGDDNKFVISGEESEESACELI